MWRFLITSLAIVFAVLALTACGATTATPTHLPNTVTSTPTVTITPTPTASATATITPFPTLGTGPYIMVKPYSESPIFSLYDMHGGKKIIELPEDAHIEGNLDRIVSPNGRWLAFYTGNANHLSEEEKLPVTLWRFNIQNGGSAYVANVASLGYVGKLLRLAKKLNQLAPEYYKPNDNGDWVHSGLMTAFERGIYAAAWSPDSRTLAFSAQIDGLSSDVYLDHEDVSHIQRAEDSLQNLTSIRWTPDGQKIIFENEEPGDIYVGSTELYAINFQKEMAKDPQLLTYHAWIGHYDRAAQAVSLTNDWLAPDVLITGGTTADAGWYGIDALNINTGKTTDLWPDSFGPYAVDPQNKTIVVGPSDYTSPKNLGVFLVRLNGQKIKIFDGLYYTSIHYRDGAKHRFVLTGISGAEIDGDKTGKQIPIAGQIIGIDNNGRTETIAKLDEPLTVRISPDLKWLLAYTKSSVYLYDEHDLLVKTFPIAGIKRIVWRPDSQAILYYTDRELSVLNLPDGNVQKIDETSIDDVLWLP